MDDFDDLDDLDDVENLDGPAVRMYRPRPDPLAFPDDILIERYRFPRAVILELCDLLADDLQRATGKSAALPVYLQVLSALKFYATGVTLSVGSEIHCIGKSSIHRCMDSVTNALVARHDQFITFPTTIDSLVEKAEKFYQIDGFPNVVGCIDGTQVPILRPRIDEELFVCRKMFHSINVQIVCDADLVITNIVAKWPGSTHDSFILHTSGINDSFESGEIGFGLLLGDSGYALKSWLMTPLQNPTSHQEMRYNWSHIRTRSSVERCIGVLKSRFRSIAAASGPLRQSPPKCCRTIVVCAILHNIARKKKLPLVAELLYDENQENVFGNITNSQQNETAVNLRRSIIARF